MVHILAPKPAHPALPVIINLQGSVGQNGMNQAEDVLFVKFCFKTMGSGPVNPVYVAPSLRVNMSNISVNPSMDAATLYIIKEYCKALNPTSEFMDSINPPKINPAPNDASYSSGKKPIFMLNQHLRWCAGENWPHIGQLPGCPFEVSASVKRGLVGT